MKEKIEKAQYHRVVSMGTKDQRFEVSCKDRATGGPAAPLPGDRPQGPVCNFSSSFFLRSSPCRPAARRPGPGRLTAGRRGYTSVNFQIENIFL